MQTHRGRQRGAVRMGQDPLAAHDEAGRARRE